MITSLMDDPLKENLQSQREIPSFCPCRSKEHGPNDLKEPYEASMPLVFRKQASTYFGYWSVSVSVGGGRVVGLDTKQSMRPLC